MSIGHIRRLRALKQLTKVNYSFNNDCHYELSVSKPYKKKQNKANCRTTKKPTILSFLLMPKQLIMEIIIKTIMTMILIIIIIIIIIITILMTEN